MKSISAHPYQIENHLIDDKFYWSRLGSNRWQDLLPLVDKVRGPLWENLSSSTSGILDRVGEERAADAVRIFGSSLCLLRVADLNIHVSVEGVAFNNAKRKVRGDFTCDGHRYRMAITDPKIEREQLAGADGDYWIGDSLLCISLGDVYNGFAYKLIAAVFVSPSR